ncbi:hypothetical protein ZYGR_0H01020 [Zygosaccharomyces rouxii]|uniref:DNA 3'-5' helicase n=2 Tax=Zygosaccharomyces rouxii TaxID=4956 RepID=C5DR82_ZYGRC|nr:uncharacterized protein ZYRO0B06292g [Zygosaccharomyces rouxii]KAH9200162.1 P-loop containing nucleoside triphosphate hydrolase protein [Zygosaccharomyces rouxii]GAV47261.1 hypothetical protein ZYGR_0H01020 [Zygosaccharomyces rouxii]CAR26293.1 ZYRO0B06292p [Zygosaccharomyces rouxii]
MELTTSQRKVIEFPYKPASTLKVVAGPGSGKTVTLLYKVRHLVETEQVRPDEILILSLTNKAVDNVIDKLLGVFEESYGENQLTDYELREIVGQIHVNTIHGLANRIIIENEGLVSIIEENGWKGLMKLLSQDLWKNQHSRLMTPRGVQKMFNEYKLGNTKKNEVMERLMKIMKDCQVFTNEDLISNAPHYLDHPSDRIDSLEGQCFTRALVDGFKVVLIDEFQDLFPSVLPMLEKIAANKQLILFGDSNQSIYNFLGDNKTVIDRLDKLHTGDNFTVVHLYDNFRSTPEIISVASKVMRHKVDLDELAKKDLVLKDPSGVYPEFQEIGDPLDELEALTEKICMLVCSGATLSDVAVLARTNAHVQIIADHLRFYGIPFRKLTAQPDWISDSRVQFLIGLLRTVVLVRRGIFEESDPLAAKRSDFSVIVTLSAIRGVGNQAIQSLFRVCNEKKVSLWNYITEVPKNEWPPAVTNRKKIEGYITMISHLMEEDPLVEIEDPLQLLTRISEAAYSLDFAPMVIKSEREIHEFKANLQEMFRVMKICSLNRSPESSLADWFLESYVEQGAIQHHQDVEFQSEGLGAVNLSTIHSSKGLEFPVVFLIGGLNHFPMEQNLLYVGMTRARNLLYLNNIKHASISSNANTRESGSALLNDKFWNYYSQDMKRPTLHSAADSIKKYEMIRKKYGFNFIGKRTITTWNYKHAISLFKRLIR